MIRYVQRDDGYQAFGEERREILELKIREDAATDAYYEAIGDLIEQRDAKFQSLPEIGGSSTLTREIWDWYFEQRNVIEDQFMYETARRPWGPGYKTPKMIQDHFDDMWFYMLKETRPTYNPEEETYTEYQIRLLEWEQQIPSIAQSMQSAMTMATMEGGWLNMRDSQFQQLGPLDQYISNLIQRTDAEAYNQWDLQRDSVYEALDKAWSSLYLDSYWLAVEGQSGPARELAERQWQKEHPTPPSDEEYVEWILQMYGNKWTTEEILEAINGRPSEELQDRLDERLGQYAEQTNHIWDTLSWIAPGQA
jgi:hypothetical protein